jgi:hypothetical protein
MDWVSFFRQALVKFDTRHANYETSKTDFIDGVYTSFMAGMFLLNIQPGSREEENLILLCKEMKLDQCQVSDLVRKLVLPAIVTDISSENE